MIIYCTGCQKDVEARLTDGHEMYPHRPDLYELPFWACECGAFVGCHHKTKDRTQPLGVLATKELKQARMKIHAILDPLWRDRKIARGQAYAYISHRLGYEYHSAEVRSVEEAQRVLAIVEQLSKELNQTVWKPLNKRRCQDAAMRGIAG